MKKERKHQAGRLSLLLFMAFAMIPGLLAQSLSVTGVVRDAGTNETLIGVNVVVEGTTKGTITNLSGYYEINVPDGNAKLVFSYMGYSPQVIPVNGRTEIDVTLQTDAQR